MPADAGTTVAKSNVRASIVSPSKLAHVVLRTNRYAVMLDWYKTVLNATPAFENGALGINPVYSINHGPTTSLYYADPDQNQLEFQVENFDTVEESGKFFFSAAFAENPIGVEFDPDDLLRRLRTGEPEGELKRRPDDGARDLSDVKLR
jgi:catechol 2,3-dioxygenase-like lactoylglutathione lyase family enzyme